jgi:hypothetical protein
MKVNFGNHNIDKIDLNFHKTNFEKILKSKTAKITGANNLNRFCKIEPHEENKKLKNFFNDCFDVNLDWGLEYFHSGEPAGLHTDYDRQYYNKADCWEGRNGEMTHYNEIVLGVIIPLDWNSRQPYTINYDKIATEPRKLMYRQGEMRYKDTNEVVDYRGSPNWWEWKYDQEVLKYNPIGSGYVGEYANLKVDSVYKWELGTMMLFDPARWHSSSWFLSTRKIPDNFESSVEYKRAIIGFGTKNVEIGTKNVL